MEQFKFIHWKGGLLVLLGAISLIIWWNPSLTDGVNYEDLKSSSAIVRSKGEAVGDGSRISIPGTAANDGVEDEDRDKQASAHRVDLLSVTLKLSTTAGIPVSGGRISVKGVFAPKWVIVGEANQSGEFTFQWPEAHAFIAKAWLNPTSGKNPPGAVEVCTPLENSSSFGIKVPGYSSLRAKIKAVGASLPGTVFVTLRRQNELDESVFGEGSFASLFRSDSDGLRNVWCGWSQLNGELLQIDDLPAGRYRVNFASSGGTAIIPSKGSEAIVFLENEITDLGEVQLSGGRGMASIRVERGDSNSAISGAQVQVIPAGAMRGTEHVYFDARSDQNGMASIPLLPPEWRLVVKKDDFATLDFSFSQLSGDRVNVLPMEKASELYVSLAWRYHGLPDPDVPIFQLGRVLAADALAQDRLYFRDVHPRPSTVILASSGNTVEIRKITLFPGRNSLSLGEVKGQTFRGIVTTVDGPINTGFVLVKTKGDGVSSGSYMQSLINGRFEIPLNDGEMPETLKIVPGGTWEDPDGYYSIPWTSDFVSNSEMGIHLPNGGLRIRVPANADGNRSISKIRVKRDPPLVLWGGLEGVMKFELHPDSNGVAEISCLPAGDYDLTWIDGSGKRNARCTIAEGIQSQIILDGAQRPN